jgi:hypothetical protein
MAGDVMFGGVPKDLSQEIAGFAERAKAPESQIESSLQENIGTGGFLQGSEMPSATAGFDNQALLSAIERRGSKKYNAEQAGLNSQIKAQALQMRMSRLTQAAQLVGAEHQQNERARMNRYIHEQNRKRARAQTLGNILGIAGAAGGALLGGPAGAAAGYQMGQGVGQSGMVG